VEVRVAVVDAAFHVRNAVLAFGVGRGDVELPGQATEVALVSEPPRDQDLPLRHVLAVLPRPGGPWIPAGEEAGAARRADGALAETAVEPDARLGEAVDRQGVDVLVPITPEGVVTLLVSADPEDVRLVVGHTLAERPQPDKGNRRGRAPHTAGRSA
jgi:hypothetical protein